MASNEEDQPVTDATGRTGEESLSVGGDNLSRVPVRDNSGDNPSPPAPTPAGAPPAPHLTQESSSPEDPQEAPSSGRARILAVLHRIENHRHECQGIGCYYSSPHFEDIQEHVWTLRNHYRHVAAYWFCPFGDCETRWHRALRTQSGYRNPSAEIRYHLWTVHNIDDRDELNRHWRDTVHRTNLLRGLFALPHVFDTHRAVFLRRARYGG